MYITRYKTASYWKVAVQHREPSLVLSDNTEGWGGVGAVGRFRREGTYVYLWIIHIVVWQKPTHYFKAIILQLKIHFLKWQKLENFKASK